MRSALLKMTCLCLLLVVVSINGFLLFKIDFGHSTLLLTGSLLMLCTVFIFLLMITGWRTNRTLPYERLFKQHPIPMWIYEKGTMRFLAVNNAAVEKYGYSKKEFRSITLKDIRSIEEAPLFVENAEERGKEEEYKGIWKHRKKDGTDFFVEVYSHPTVYYGKKARFIMAKDVDSQVRASKEAYELGLRYELLAQATNDAIYDKDLVANAVIWNHGLYSLFKHESSEGTDVVQWWQQNIHEADYARVNSSLEICIKEHLNYWSEEYRFKCADGHYKYVVDRAFIIYENGQALRMIGMMQDIDKHVKQARQLEEQNKTLKEIAWINSHEIRRPVVSILSITGLFDKSNQDMFLNAKLMEWLQESTLQLDEIIHKIEHKAKKLQ